MYIEVIDAKFKEDKKIFITFNDGKQGVVDFNYFIQKGGVFKELSNQLLFERFEIDKDFGALKWNDSLDISPESLYSRV